MRTFGEQGLSPVTFEENRLETPSMVGYRRGMSSSGVIGTRLGAVYNVERELPEEMDSALRQLNRRMADGR